MVDGIFPQRLMTVRLVMLGSKELSLSNSLFSRAGKLRRHQLPSDPHQWNTRTTGTSAHTQTTQLHDWNKIVNSWCSEAIRI